jgi:hypothetical protein
MATLHPHLFQQSIVDKNEIRQLVTNYFLSNRVMLQWRPAAREVIPTPNTKEIVVFSSFFSADLSSLPMIFYADSLITTKSS